MSVRLDPDGHEIDLFLELVGDLKGKRVLEIGCGDGRLTWLYAELTARVEGIDPDEEDIALARQNTPPSLTKRVRFQAVDLEKFSSKWKKSKSKQPYDLAILAWSL